MTTRTIKNERELNNLVVLLRGLISMMPLMALARELAKLPTSEVKKIFTDEEKLEALGTYIKKCEEIDKILEPIDIKMFGRPMGIWQFIKLNL